MPLKWFSGKESGVVGGGDWIESMSNADPDADKGPESGTPSYIQPSRDLESSNSGTASLRRMPIQALISLSGVWSWFGFPVSHID